MNTAFFGGAAPDDIWLEGDLEILRRCDAVLCVDGWQSSKGATAEVGEARQRSIPVFESVGAVQSWLAEGRA